MNSLDLEQQNLEQRKRMAEMLRMQNQQPQGQMVSGHYVAPSALSHLVPIANQLAGKYAGDKADKDMQALGQRRNQSLVEGLRNYAQLAKGTPAETIQPLTPNDDEGNAMPVAQRDAVAGNSQAAAESLLSNENPQLQQLGMQQLIAGLVPKQAKWEKVEMPNPDGSVQTGFVDVNSPRPFETFQAGGTKPVKNEYVNNVGVNPYTGERRGGPVTNEASDILIPGSDGKLTANQPLIGAKSAIAAAGRPQVNVDARNFNTQESEQSKAYGKTLGDMRGNIMQAGYDAPGKLAQFERMEGLLQGVGGGAAAPTLAQIGSIANSFGIKLDPKLGQKEASEALAREIAASFRQPGTGPMTDKDFDNFLKRVPDLSKTPQGRAEILKTTRAGLERDIRAAQFAREYASKNNGVIDDNFFSALQDFYVKNPIVSPQMPSKNASGNVFKDADAILNRGR